MLARSTRFCSSLLKPNAILLGLYLIRELVSRLGGSIEYARRDGSVFTVGLPWPIRSVIAQRELRRSNYKPEIAR